MSLTCPKCGSSGEFIKTTEDGKKEDRRCRQCGHVYRIILDVDDDPYPDQEPYIEEEDLGWGTCPECGSYLYNGGACSDGDGDLYDELICPLCQEQRGHANERWFDEEGNEIPAQ